MLHEKYHWTTEESRGISEFLLPMLDLTPEKRANAGGMAMAQFMDGTKNMESIRVDIPVGSKGEGIEGWATEIKKR